MKKKVINLSLEQRRNMKGYIFVLPFIIGMLFFFIIPAIQSIVYCFNEIKITPSGYVLNNVGFSNINKAINVDPQFRIDLSNAFKKMCIEVPMIVIFSFFAATILNQNFKGKLFARIIFFLPVIMISGALLRADKATLFSSIIEGISTQDAETVIGQGEGVILSFNLAAMLSNSGLPIQLTNYIMSAISGIYPIIINSGIQILIFLSGLQTISPSLFEASDIEGATAWENFWKITFPMVSPMILANALYTIIDSFTRDSSPLIQQIRLQTFVKFNFGYGSTMAWIYFITIFVTVTAFGYIASKKVFYYE